MKDIGYVLSVISTSDIMKLNLATFDAVSAVGRPIKVSTEQVRSGACHARVTNVIQDRNLISRSA